MARFDDDLRGQRDRHDEAPAAPGPNEAYRVGPDARGEDLHDPYSARRHTPVYRDDRRWAAEHPWQAAHPDERPRFAQRPAPPGQVPARYGGSYREDDPQWSARRLDAAGYGGEHDPRAFGDEEPYSHYGSYGTAAATDRGGQTNSGYDANRSWGEGGRGSGAPTRDAGDRATGAPRGYAAPRPGAPARGMHGSQQGRADTHGSAGWQQQGKRYWFDGDDAGPSPFRGVGPRGYRRSDERLREIICEALTDADLDASDVGVEVTDGVVTLEGSVPVRWMKHQAEDIADDCGGVKDIRNQLRVRGRGPAASASGQQEDEDTASTRPH